jgi:hypothetical protein
MSDAAYFIGYDSDAPTVVANFRMQMDALGSHQFGRVAWILRTEKSYDEILASLHPFQNGGGTLFIVRICLDSSQGRLFSSLPSSFTHDPVTVLLMGLEPCGGNK